MKLWVLSFIHLPSGGGSDVTSALYTSDEHALAQMISSLEEFYQDHEQHAKQLRADIKSLRSQANRNLDHLYWCDQSEENFMKLELVEVQEP